LPNTRPIKLATKIILNSEGGQKKDIVVKTRGSSGRDGGGGRRSARERYLAISFLSQE
jgi:hypothetical protein